MVPMGHEGSLYVVVVGDAATTPADNRHLQFVDLGKTPERSTMPVQYSCRSRSQVRSPSLSLSLSPPPSIHTYTPPGEGG